MTVISQLPLINRYKILRKIICFKKKILFENNYKIGFIHITKSGGTDIKDKNTNSEIYFGLYHYEDGYFYQNYMPCFAIIREPIERFKSTFFYNMYGSEKYNHKRFYHCYSDINQFIDDCIKEPELLCKIENGWQFRPQYEWLTGNKENTFLIKYNKYNNCNNIIYFLKKEFDIDYKYNSVYRKINTTIYNSYTKSDINEKNYNFLRDYYNEDFIIYEKLSNTKQPYVRFSEI